MKKKYSSGELLELNKNTYTTEQIRSSDNQREKTNNARNNGDLFRFIIETLTEAGGILERLALMEKVADDIGLTNDERVATHINDSGKIMNSYENPVDWVGNEMKHGKYGPEAAKLETDGSGVWILDSPVDIGKAIRWKGKISAKSIKAKEELRECNKDELYKEYKTLDELSRELFKKSSGTMDKCLALMDSECLSATAAIETFLKR